MSLKFSYLIEFISDQIKLARVDQSIQLFQMISQFGEETTKVITV